MKSLLATPEKAPPQANGLLGAGSPLHNDQSDLKPSANQAGQLAKRILTASAEQPSALTSPQEFHPTGGNDVVALSEGTQLFRGDDHFHPKQSGYSAQFFLRDKANTKNYGQIILGFRLKQDIQLLALDKNVEGFKNWLKHNDTDSLTILHQNFGYPRNNVLNASGIRKRDSVADKDRALLQSIKNYAVSNGFKGYHIQQMSHADAGRGDFHGEVAIWDTSVLSEPNLLSKQSSAEIQQLNEQAKLQKHEPKKRKLDMPRFELDALPVRKGLFD